MGGGMRWEGGKVRGHACCGWGEVWGREPSVTGRGGVIPKPSLCVGTCRLPLDAFRGQGDKIMPYRRRGVYPSLRAESLSLNTLPGGPCRASGSSGPDAGQGPCNLHALLPFRQWR